MKPFNLEEFKSGKKAVTRDGRIAIYAGYNPNASEIHRIVGWVSGHAESWMEDGRWRESWGYNSDLIGMAPEKKTVWVNLWKDGEAYWYEYENLAKHGLGEANKNFIGTFPLEIEV